jgi:hypothetical protein
MRNQIEIIFAEEIVHIGEEDHLIESENVKHGDYIYPWDDTLNPNGNKLYEALTVDVKSFYVFIRLRSLAKDSFKFIYRVKKGSKERVFIPR